MTDTMETLGRSIIQHGKLSDRIYLMKLAREDGPGILEPLNRLARDLGYSKIFAKVPESFLPDFQGNGFEVEARVPGFFGGEEAGCFLGKFLDPRRRENSDSETIENVLAAAREKSGSEKNPKLPEGMGWRLCGPEDAEEMARVYKTVFETYPFPIHRPGYLKETMETHVVYFAVTSGSRIVSLSSSEIAMEDLNVEMTDFATLPRFRRRNLATFLLTVMDEEMGRRGLKVGYTIARALSYGMNITFSKVDYRYGGTLLNNTAIAGHLESMNVWYKPLD
jgi:putative beta-lysine N-acetyltransferase